MGRTLSTLGASALMIASMSCLAADGITVTRAADTTVYGNCVPSLSVDNKSSETIDYLQVDLVLSLASGQQRVVELKSAYRDGVLYPIAPGGQATLKQHLDTSLPTGVACAEITARKAVRTICEAQNGTACASQVVVQP
jgi:hypothetical protein